MPSVAGPIAAQDHGRKAGARRQKRFFGTRRRAQRASRHGDEEEDEEQGRTGPGWHWYIIGLSILLVITLSFMNFLALPRMAATPHEQMGAALVNSAPGALLPAVGGIAAEGHGQLRGPAWQQAARSLMGMAAAAAQVPAPPAGQAGLVVVGASLPAAPAAGFASAPPVADVAASAAAAAAGVLGSQAASGAQAAQGAGGAPPTKQPAHAAIASAGGIGVFNGIAWLKMPHSVDNEEVAFSAWVYLPKVSELNFPESSASMKTIAATKLSGCKTHGETTAGWAFFVHEWGTTNRQLRVSWTDGASACHEVYSADALVPYDQWVGVGFSFSRRANTVAVFLGGSEVVNSKSGLGNYMKQGQLLPLTEVDITNRAVARGGGLFLGSHMPQNSDPTGSQSHMFVGTLGDVRLVHKAADTVSDYMAMLGMQNGARSGADASHLQQLVVQVSFRVSGPLVNEIDRTQFEVRRVGVGGSDTFIVEEYQDSPRPPVLLHGRATAGVDSPAGAPVEEAPFIPPPPVQPGTPGPTLDPAALRATWPAEWTKRWQESELLHSQREADGWAEEVRNAMRHTWNGYKERAWGRDEVKPVSGGAKDWCRMAITMLDGMSTLWLMGLHDEFNEGEQWVKQMQIPTAGKHGQHSLFEITIRALGGLLSAYSLSNRTVFLQAAQRLADHMMPAFGTPSGMPMSQFDVGTGESSWHSWTHHAVLAEVGTVQMEMRFLSHATGDRKYAAAGDKALNALLAAANGRGLVPIYLSRDDQVPRFIGSKISLGAMGDSYYEYLLKQWILVGKKEDRLKDIWKQAMREMVQQLVLKTAGGRTFVAESEGGSARHRMDHLACFVAGMLMLGNRNLPAVEVVPEWETLAAEITETCHEMYRRTPTGLSPEYMHFHISNTGDNDMSVPADAPQNLLRPEAIEACYYMWYYTGDPKYRRWAYEMFSAFNRHCRVRWGFSSLLDVRKNPPRHKDAQESFWLAETLKYLFLIFAPRNTLNLEEFVLNTEAQPFRIWQQ